VRPINSGQSLSGSSFPVRPLCRVGRPLFPTPLAASVSNPPHVYERLLMTKTLEPRPITFRADADIQQLIFQEVKRLLIEAPAWTTTISTSDAVRSLITQGILKGEQGE